MVDSWTYLRGDKKFFCVTMWAKLWPRLKRLEPEVLPPLDGTHIRYPSAKWQAAISKRWQKRSGQALFFFFFFRCTASQCICWKCVCLVSPTTSMIPMANASDDHNIFVFSPWSAVFLFRLIVCFFRALALIFKKYWTRNVKNKRHAETLTLDSPLLYCWKLFSKSGKFSSSRSQRAQMGILNFVDIKEETWNQNLTPECCLVGQIMSLDKIWKKSAERICPWPWEHKDKNSWKTVTKGELRGSANKVFSTLQLRNIFISHNNWSKGQTTLSTKSRWYFRAKRRSRASTTHAFVRFLFIDRPATLRESKTRTKVESPQQSSAAGKCSLEPALPALKVALDDEC